MRKVKLVAIGLLTLLCYPTLQAQTSIEVSGKATKSIKAQSIEIEVTVLNREKSSEKALGKTSGSIEDMMEFISETRGVSKMATSGLTIEGNWNRTAGEYEYVSRESLRIKIDSVPAYDYIMKNLAKKGMDEVGAVKYSISNEEEVHANLLKMALKNARTKADAIASEMNFKVGFVNTFTEVESSAVADYYSVYEEPDRAISMLPSNVSMSVIVNVSFGVKK
jgi:uncharacterized protein YggE